MTQGAGAGERGFSLDARERLLSEAERIAHSGSFAWDVATGTIHWSDELFRIFGRDATDFVPTTEAFFAAVHPDDLASVQVVAERGLTTGVAEPADFRILRPDGSIRNIHMIGKALLDDSGRASRFVGSLLDVTDRLRVETDLKRSELVLRQAQRVAHVGSFEWDPESGEMQWSDELRRIFGVGQSEAHRFDVLAKLVHPDDRAGLDDLRRRALTSPTPMIECRVVRRDGQTRYVRIHTRAFRDDRGDRIGIVGSVHDVTELRKLEVQLLQSQKMDALGRLAGGVAHDFNNLLAVIGLHVSRMRRDSQAPGLAAIATAVEHGAALTGQLLAFSRQSPLTMRSVDVGAIVTDAMNMVDRLFDSNIRFTCRIAAGTHLTDADPAQMTQVLMNLLLNARDAMSGGGTITIELASRTIELASRIGGADVAAGDYVTLTVRDEGEGMNEDVRTRMFEPFFTTKELGRGTGLGLSMVFGIVSQLGGAIEVESDLGCGTAITVILPRATGDHARTTPADVLVREPDDALVLLVEDEAPLREVLGEILVDAGYRVRAADDGVRGLDLFRSDPDAFALVVTDIRMPGMSGPEMIERIRQTRSSLPVLFISGHAPETVALAQYCDATRFLRKPFAPSQLVDVVRDLVDAAARI